MYVNFGCSLHFTKVLSWVECLHCFRISEAIFLIKWNLQTRRIWLLLPFCTVLAPNTKTGRISNRPNLYKHNILNLSPASTHWLSNRLLWAQYSLIVQKACWIPTSKNFQLSFLTLTHCCVLWLYMFSPVGTQLFAIFFKASMIGSSCRVVYVVKYLPSCDCDRVARLLQYTAAEFQFICNLLLVIFLECMWRYRVLIWRVIVVCFLCSIVIVARWHSGYGTGLAIGDRGFNSQLLCSWV